MKKNATLIAGILFVAGCASSQDQRASYSQYHSPSRYDRADISVSSTEHIERTPTQSPIPASDVDVSSSVSQGSSVGSPAGSVSGSVSGSNYDPDSEGEFSINDSERDTDLEAEYTLGRDDDFSADSSIRGGSLDARGYDQDANNDELEGKPDPINPGKQADSSVRGGSIYSREREWNHDSELSTGQRDPERHMTADSSIRGGSIEARGAREAVDYEDYSDAQSGFNVDAHIRSAQEGDQRDDFGQGSSATWESDKAEGSVRGSANWNPSDDLMLDGIDESEAQSTTTYEFNNDASVGGAARSEVGAGASSLDDEELDSENSALEPENESDSSIRIESDLNSSEQLESNISGELDLEDQEAKTESERFGTAPDFHSSTEPDVNSTDAFTSSSSSARATDIYHDEADLIEAENESDEMEVEAAGAAASSEVGSSSSHDNEFKSNDPALNNAGSPLGTSGNEPNFLYQDNRAQGVGSAASGEFATSPVNQGASLEMSDNQLAEHVKGTLTRESTGTHGLMMQEVARNVQVSAQDGEVTLTGTVPTEKHKEMIEVRAREISGVKSVNNQLTVTPEADAARRDITRGSDLEDITSDLQD